MYLNSSLNEARSSWKKRPVAGQLWERPGQSSGPPPNCPPHRGPWDSGLWGMVVVWPPLISAETLPGPLPCFRCAQMVGLICCSFSPDTHHLLTLYSYPWQARWMSPPLHFTRLATQVSLPWSLLSPACWTLCILFSYIHVGLYVFLRGGVLLFLVHFLYCFQVVSERRDQGHLPARCKSAL